jgi:histidinol-phosphate aminotransferase
MSAVHNIIPSVRELGAYTLAVTEARIRLDRNESPYDLPEAARAAILEDVQAQAWNRYPDFTPQDVLSGLGERHGLTGAHVLIGNGSNELIQAVLTATVGAGTKVYLPEPTFSLYKMMVLANEGTPAPLPLGPDLEYDEAAWRAAAAASDGHLLLCSPNNPTGSVVSPTLVAELATKTERLVILDEAYAQFGPHDLSGLVADHPNVIVLRTFSKAVGLAGVRLGYALAGPELATQISKVKLPYNVGHFGLAVARYALAHPEVLQGAAEALLAARERLEAALAALPFDSVRGGHANFVLVRTTHAKALFAHLLSCGILVRDVGGYPQLQDCLRITVGTDPQIDALLAGCREFFEER